MPVPAALFAVRFVSGKELRCAASSEESMEAAVVPAEDWLRCSQL